MGNVIYLFLINVVFLLFAPWLFQLFGEGKLLLVCSTHWFRCCQLHSWNMGFLVLTVERGWDIHGAAMEKLETRGHCSLEDRRGTSQLRYPLGDECNCPQVMSGSFLAGKPRSHPEGVNWVRTRSISRSSRAVTTAQSWWRTIRCSSSAKAGCESAAAFALYNRDDHGMGLPWAGFAISGGPIGNSGMWGCCWAPLIPFIQSSTCSSRWQLHQQLPIGQLAHAWLLF